MALRSCPSCRGEHLLDVSGHCARCRGEWVAGAHVGPRVKVLQKFVGRGPPTDKNCPWDKAALKAFDVPGFQYEGDLFWGQEKARADGTCVAEGCSACGGAWFESDQLARGGGRRAVVEGLVRLAETLA